MPDSLGFLCLVVLIYSAGLRVRELFVSRAHQSTLAMQGYKRKDGFGSYCNMVLLHLTFFIAVAVELFTLQTLAIFPIQIVAFCFFLFSQVLRFYALQSLGKYWNTNIMSAHGTSQFVQQGPYQFIRHPNYLAVILEFISIPLIGGCWRSALVYSIWNGVVLRYRIKEEEQELFKISGYREVMGPKKRFIPGIV